MTTLINVRAGEGGDDSKLLVQEMVSIYKKWLAQEKIHVTEEG